MRSIPHLCLFILLIGMLPAGGYAQTVTFDQVRKLRTRGIGTIENDNQVVGYYFFYEQDKADRQNRNYILQVTDAAGKSVMRKSLTRPKRVVLSEVSFNGSAFLLFFKDPKERSFEFVTYDRSGERIGRKFRKDLSRPEFFGAKTTISGEETEREVYPVANQGFVVYGNHPEEKRGYTVTYYPNDFDRQSDWTKKSKPKLVQKAFFSDFADGVLYNLIYDYKRTNRKKITIAIQAIDLASGKIRYETPVIAPPAPLTVINSFYDEASKQLFAVGTFHKDNTNAFGQPRGIYVMTLDADGKRKHIKMLDYDSAFDDFVEMSKRGKIKEEGGGLIYFHRMIRRGDRVFLIGENYKKTADGLGIASAVLGGDGNLTKIQIGNMTILELNEKLELVDYQSFDKTRSNVYPNNFDPTLVPIAVLGNMLRQSGDFDYLFTTTSRKDNNFYASYLNFMRDKEAKGLRKRRLTVGTIVFDEEAGFTEDKFQIDTRGTRIFRVMEGKPGYVMLLEYNAREKAVDLTPQKIEF